MDSPRTPEQIVAEQVQLLHVEAADAYIGLLAALRDYLDARIAPVVDGANTARELALRLDERVSSLLQAAPMTADRHSALCDLAGAAADRAALRATVEAMKARVEQLRERLWILAGAWAGAVALVGFLVATDRLG